jgi:DedD protein
VERQLKERLIGAAVLVAIAVIMVPEMFSGPHSHADSVVDSDSTSSAQIKTYHLELQSAHSSGAATASAVEPPAAQPRDEVPIPTNEAAIAASSAASSSSTSSASPVSTPTRMTMSASSVSSVAALPVKPTATPKPAPDVEAPAKQAAINKSEGEWLVQVGSFASEDKARQIITKLKSQGHAAYLGKVTVAGKTLYRVRVGAMSSREAAEAAMRKINATYPGTSVVPANH